MKSYQELILAKDAATEKLQEVLQKTLMEIEEEFLHDFGISAINLRIGLLGNPICQPGEKSLYHKFNPTFAGFRPWIEIHHRSGSANLNSRGLTNGSNDS